MTVHIGTPREKSAEINSTIPPSTTGTGQRASKETSTLSDTGNSDTRLTNRSPVFRPSFGKSQRDVTKENRPTSTNNDKGQVTT